MYMIYKEIKVVIPKNETFIYKGHTYQSRMDQYFLIYAQGDSGEKPHSYVVEHGPSQMQLYRTVKFYPHAIRDYIEITLSKWYAYGKEDREMRQFLEMYWEISPSYKSK